LNAVGAKNLTRRSNLKRAALRDRGVHPIARTRGLRVNEGGMESVDKFGLLGADGRPLSERIAHVLQYLVPKLRRTFPTLGDEVQLTEILEEAGRRIADHEARCGAIEKLHGYAWVTIRSVATSRVRRSSAKLAQATVGLDESRKILSTLTAESGSAEQIEREILVREVLAGLTADEQLVCIWKKAGFSSREIAEYRGTSVGAVDVVFCRAKDKIRKALGLEPIPHDVGAPASPSKPFRH
jgi:RNA polymerase sigma factor (sigma-70 family)